MRQPSLRAAGANQCSSARRSPASAPTRLTRTISPPGFSTRANSSSVASGLGTVVTTYCATTTSNESSGKVEPLGVHHLEALDMLSPSSATRSRALRSIGSEMSTPTDAVAARIVGQRDAGADADLEDAAADALGRLDRGPPAALEHRRRTPDRRPAPSAHRPWSTASLVDVRWLSVTASPLLALQV